MSNKKIAVVYHGDCPDGFSGAWAAWKKFGNKAEYIGALDRVNPPKGLRGKEVYFIDWVYDLKTMQKVRRSAKKVIAIDHHQTAESACRAMDECVFDNAHSGAVLAWRYFHPSKALPRLLRHVEDVDLWNWSLPGSKQVSAFLEMQPFDLKHWDSLVKQMEGSGRKLILEQGKVLVAYEDRLIKMLVKDASLVRFEGRRVLALNSPLFTSQLGNILSHKQAPFAVIWREEKGAIRVSLRSVPSFDVSKIAKKYGGGGHRNSAGFRVDAKKPLPWKPI